MVSQLLDLGKEDGTFMSETTNGELLTSSTTVSTTTVKGNVPGPAVSSRLPPTIAAVSKQVAHGTIWTVCGRTAALLASFFSTPFLTRLLGSEQYGIWALANTLNTYLSFTTMGMGTASTRFAAKPYTHSDEAGEAAVVWTSLLITIVPATVVMLIVILAARLLVSNLFSVPQYLQPEAAIVLQLTAIGFVARIFAEIFNTPQLVRLRLDLFTYVSMGTLIVQHGCVVIVLVKGGGLLGATGVVTSCSLILALMHVWVSRTLLPSLFRPRIDVKLIKPLLRFGSGVVLSTLLGILVLANIERVFLAYFSSVRELAYYSIAASLASLVSFIPSSMNQSLMPAMSTLHAAKDKIRLEALYVQALRAVLFCVLPMALMVCVAGEPFLRLWAGPEYAANSTYLLYILMVGVIFNIAAAPPYILLTAAGRTGTIAKCHLAETIPHLIYTSLLIFVFGAVGAALAWSLRTLVDAILLLAAARQEVSLSWQVLSGGWRAYGIALLMLVGTALVSFYFGGNLFVRLAIATIGCAGYCGVIWKKILNTAEQMFLLRLLRLRSANC